MLQRDRIGKAISGLSTYSQKEQARERLRRERERVKKKKRGVMGSLLSLDSHREGLSPTK